MDAPSAPRLSGGCLEVDAGALPPRMLRRENARRHLEFEAAHRTSFQRTNRNASHARDASGGIDRLRILEGDGAHGTFESASGASGARSHDLGNERHAPEFTVRPRARHLHDRHIVARRGGREFLARFFGESVYVREIGGIGPAGRDPFEDGMLRDECSCGNNAETGLFHRVGKL